MYLGDIDIPLWLIITFSVAYLTWPLLIAAGGTVIGALITAFVAKSALALKVAAVAAAVFFSPLAIGVVGAPFLTMLDNIGDSYANSSFNEWQENTPLIRAVKKQDEKKVAKLLKKGADPNEYSKYKRRTPLSESCKAYADEAKADRITALLLEAGADANQKVLGDNTAMEKAVLANRHGAIRLLCTHGYKCAGEDGQGSYIVNFAVHVSHYEEACLLLELGVLPCARYNHGFCREDFTPFMYIFKEPIFYRDTADPEAAEKKLAALIRLFTLLLERGADVNAWTTERWHPSVKTALLLLADSYTTLRLDSPKLQLAKMLLDAGADVNAKDVDGKTALHGFAQISWSRKLEDMEKWIRLLTSYGADKTLRDKDGCTPLDIFHRSCDRNGRDIDGALYDEVERLLTPDAEKTAQKPVPEPQGGNIVAKSRFEKNAVEVKIAAHRLLEDVSDNW